MRHPVTLHIVNGLNACAHLLTRGPASSKQRGVGAVAMSGGSDLRLSTASFDTETSATPEQQQLTNPDPPRIAAMDFVSESLKVRDACACAGLTGMQRVRGHL